MPAKAAIAEADWFRVDRKGLAQQLERRSKVFAAFELYQNAVDTGAKRVEMTLERVDARSARLAITDDDPDGFKDLTHAYTLFAPSEKKGDPTKRGRFNVGEKLVLAICDSATITSTKGGVRFDAAGRSDIDITERRSRGSCFDAIIRFNKDDIADVARRIHELIVPAGVHFTFNGTEIVGRTPALTFQATLASEIANIEGNMVRTFRKTTLALYDVRPGEQAQIYELGIPVVEHDCRWHVDVHQKVPLNIDRDNVTPAFLRDLRTAILNNAYRVITEEDAKSTWVKEALPHASDEAVTKVITERYGEKAVAADMSDPEGTKIAVSQDYTVVHGGSLSKAEWERVRELGLLKPAGQVTPSPKVLCGPDGEPPLDDSRITPAMRRIQTYAAALGTALLGFEPTVKFAGMPGNKAAWYGGRTVTLNLMVLGHHWFDRPDQVAVDSLLIHEYAHELSKDHLSEEFHDATCKLGAKMHGIAVTFPLAQVR